MRFRASPPLFSKVSWDCWKWSLSRPFVNPSTRNIYLKLRKPAGWKKSANSCWKVDWPTKKWEQTVGRLWASKGREHMKVFIWKSLIGALPTEENAECKGIESAVCKRCKANIEIVHHLFRNCPCISFVGKAICKWIFGIWGVKLSKM